MLNVLLGLLVNGKTTRNTFVPTDASWENIDVIHTYYILFYNATLDYITLSEYPRWYHVYLPGYTYLKLMAKYIIHSYLLHPILVFNIPKPRKVTL